MDYQPEGVHPNATGVGKVATRLFEFFRAEPTTAWYRAPDVGMGLTEEVTSNAITLYPNPTDGLLWMDVPLGSMPQVRVFDASGRQVLQVQGRWLDLGGMPAGVYAVEVMLEGRRWLGRGLKTWILDAYDRYGIDRSCFLEAFSNLLLDPP